MNHFWMKFETDNAAFDTFGAEVVRILKTAIAKIEGGELDGPAVDANGNTVGHWIWEVEDDDDGEEGEDG